MAIAAVGIVGAGAVILPNSTSNSKPPTTLESPYLDCNSWDSL